jgi:hypothetical protein
MNKVIIDEVDVSGCEFCSATGQCKIQQVFQRNEIVGIIEKPYGVHLECNLCDKDCYYKQLKRLQAENERLKEENEELCDRMAKVTYRATGGRLSYSNYTLDAIEQVFYDQLEILSDQKSEEYIQALQNIRDIARKIG